jgi:hypothetical protein
VISDLGVLARGGVDADRLCPRRFGQPGDRVADALIEIKAKREAQPRLTAVDRQRMRRAGAVGAHQDVPLERDRVELLEREVEHGDVIGGAVAGGVGGPQDRGRRLARRVQVAQQRVMTLAALEVRGRLLLLRVAARQRRVDIQDRQLRARPERPRARPRDGDRAAQPLPMRWALALPLSASAASARSSLTLAGLR